MVLPRCILFPQAILPLYIFENRYRQMLQDCLGSHRMFGIGTLRQDQGDVDGHGDESIYDVLGVGLIRTAVQNSDSASNVILQGVCRARITSLRGGKPYQRAQILPLSTSGDDNVTVDALAAKVAELVTIRSKLGADVPEKVLKFLTNLRDPSILSDLVSFAIFENYHDKQNLLETLDLRVRLKKVITLLQNEIQRLEAL